MLPYIRAFLLSWAYITLGPTAQTYFVMYKLVVLFCVALAGSSLASEGHHHGEEAKEKVVPAGTAYLAGGPSWAYPTSHLVAAPALAYSGHVGYAAAPAIATGYAAAPAIATGYAAAPAIATGYAAAPAIATSYAAAPAIATYAAAPAIAVAPAARLATPAQIQTTNYAIQKNVHYASQPVVTGYSTSIVKPNLGALATPLQTVSQQSVLAAGRQVQTITPHVTRVEPELHVQKVPVDVPVPTPVVSEVEVRTPVVQGAPVVAAPAVHVAHAVAAAPAVQVAHTVAAAPAFAAPAFASPAFAASPIYAAPSQVLASAPAPLSPAPVEAAPAEPATPAEPAQPAPAASDEAAAPAPSSPESSADELPTVVEARALPIGARVAHGF